MLERRVSPDDVRSVVDAGETIEEDASDRPYPSFLILGRAGGRVLHVVLGYDATREIGYVIRTYEPDPESWDPDWKTRRTR